ncbi:MAG TPA: site-2 protease family protein [Candidatus Saccharimonadales bacterium]|nr:site-2 protease family protein [Candidatus Saccharimonadales bacterium]
MTVVIFIIGLILFVLLVVVHELGHAIVAHRNGVVVEEFGIGFPPRLWKRVLKKSKTVFSLNALPIGGFVRLKGEHDNDKGPGTYGGSSFFVKAKILLAGVAVNWITAAVIFTVLALTGIPQLVGNQFTVKSDTKVINNVILVSDITSHSPAAKSGLKVGDQLLKVGSASVTSTDQLVALTHRDAGKKVDIVYSRSDTIHTTTATLNKIDKDNQGYLGVVPLSHVIQRSTWSAPIVGVGLTAQLTKLTLQGLWDVLDNLGTGLFQSLSPNAHQRATARTRISDAGQNVAGPVGIVVLLKDVSSQGVSLMLYLIAVISLTLAVMNVLPIPALDGGRLFVMLLYRLRRKRLTEEVEERIQGYAFAVLMGLIVLLTVVDVRHFL